MDEFHKQEDDLGYNVLETAPVAQWTEHLTSDQTVERSNRSGGARYIKRLSARLPVAIPRFTIIMRLWVSPDANFRR